MIDRGFPRHPVPRPGGATNSLLAAYVRFRTTLRAPLVAAEAKVS